LITPQPAGTMTAPTQQRKNCTAHQGQTQPANPQKLAKPPTLQAAAVAHHNTTPNTVH